MNKKFKFASAILSAGLLITPVSGLVSNYDNVAKADYSIISNSEEENIVINLTKQGVDKEKIENVIKKIKSKEQLEATKKDSVPYKTKKYTENNKNIEILYYQDGSTSTTTVEKMPMVFRSVGLSCGTGACWSSDYKLQKEINGGNALGCYANLEYTSQNGVIHNCWDAFFYNGGVVTSGPYLSHGLGYSNISLTGTIYGQYYSANFYVGPGGISIS